MADVTLTTKEFTFLKEVFCAVFIQHPINITAEAADRFEMPEWDALCLKLGILKDEFKPGSSEDRPLEGGELHDV